jgi:DNA-binding MarR family transcriptional regulator
MMNDPDEMPVSDVLSKALAMFEEAAKEPRLTSAQIHALLFIASDTQITKHLGRLPTISDIARATGLTHSGGSRLLGSLLKDGLVINDRGIMGNRSEAFVLSARGKERVSRLLEAMVASPVPELRVHGFWTYAEKRFAGM